jgi:CheY-like chemotaxis protein
MKISRTNEAMNKTILLVDDVQMFIEIQKEFLQESPVNILTARNGEEALDVIKNSIPDLVFMDLHMPNMDGAECCKAIKSDPLLPGLPVIMVTALGKTEDTEHSFTAGCDDFLTKPLDRDLFLEAARRFIPGIDRRHKRKSIRVNGVFSSNEESIACILHDISVGGAYIVSEHEVTPRKIIKLYFSMPDGAGIECHGRVVWTNSDCANSPKGFGVQFALMPKKTKEIISNYIWADR